MNTGDRKIVWKNWIYVAAAVVVLALLWCFTSPNRQKKLERTHPKIVVLGDSLTGQCRDETSVTEQLSALLGEQVFNGAMGGTCLSPVPGMLEENYSKELLNLVSLTKAIVADDFGVQQTVCSKETITEYFADNIDELERIDFGTVEILLLEYGLNDYHAAVPIENENDPYDENTFRGAFRSVIRALRRKYPEMRIVAVTPTYTWYISDELTCEDYDPGNGDLGRYVDALMDVADEMGVETIDLFHSAYAHDAWEDWMTYTEDGMHPNELGRQIMAERIADGLRSGR